MTSFDEREQNFEKKFKHDQELRFKTIARRNKLLGHWVAARLGLDPAAAEAYAKTVVEAEFEGPGGVGVREKVLKDLSAKGISMSPAELEREMERLLATAKEQLLKHAT